MAETSDASSGSRSRIPGGRAIAVTLRSLHIAAMALVLGGLPRGAGFEDLKHSIYATILTGFLLLVVELVRRCLVLSQGSGVALLLKLALLGLGNLFPAARLEWYLAATFVASIGAHMAGDWRHFSFLKGRVIESGERD